MIARRKQFRPMKACDAPAVIKFPKLVQPKIDGLRATIVEGKLLTSALKPFPNRHVSEALSLYAASGLDGELIAAPATDPAVYRKSVSALKSVEGIPDWKFVVFDDYLVSGGYRARLHLATAKFCTLQCYQRLKDNFVVIPSVSVGNRQALEFWETEWLKKGYEGVMLRDPQGPYKFGRTTEAEDNLFKLKRFLDSEAEIVGVEEELENRNPLTYNERGLAQRSTEAAGMFRKGTMGALVVRDIHTGVVFNIGSGFTAAERAQDWPVGTIVKYKYLPTGSKDKPRHPVFLGIRLREDM